MSTELDTLVQAHVEPQLAMPEMIATALRDAIFQGVIPAGTALKQDEIAARFGVSRIPVREALQKLASEGIAQIRRNRGVIVAVLSEDDFTEIMELRALLEPHALVCSAPNLTLGDIQIAEQALREAMTNGEVREQARLHWDFHRRLYAKANRPRLLGQIESLHVNIHRYLLPVWSAAGLSEHWDESHFAITNALRAGDATKASELVRQQIGEASDRVLVHLREQKQQETA